MAVRRSARIRSQTPPERPEPQREPVNNLPSVTEHEEPSPNVNAKTTRTPIQSPGQKTPTSNKKQFINAKTPTSVSTVHPTMKEMHPSKVQQSTTKQADSGLVLGFNPVKKDANGNVIQDPVHNTPSKTPASPAQFGTPVFDYKFSCQESQLSDEAKKLMESVREEAARLRPQMTQDKGKQVDTEHTADALRGGRKIAQPKGKAGRFSDAHMAEFKKMDSIAGHASAFRATPGRFQPVNKSLKRSNSKIRLEEPNNLASPSKSPVKASPLPTETGVKRVKHDKTDDASARRSPSKESDAPKPGTPKPVNRRAKTAVRSSLMTPTKATLARNAASVRPPKTSMIPSLARSPAAKGVSSPQTPRTDFNPRFKSHLPTFSGLKSILRRHQPLFSKDPVKIAAGTHVAAPDFSLDLSVHDNSDPQTPSPKKHVNFSAGTKSPFELAQASPSPSKIPVQARSGSDVAYPILPTLTPEKDTATEKPASIKAPTIRQVPSDTATQPAQLPELPSVPHGIGHKKRRREETNDDDAENMPPPDAVEQSAKRVKVNTPAPKNPSSSPLKGRTNTPRQGTPSRDGTPASAKRKGVLSLSRLNMLAKPKNRT